MSSRLSYLKPATSTAAGTAAEGFVLASLASQLQVLKAAGIQVIAPQGGSALEQAIRTLEGNLDWLIITVIGLVLTAVVALLMFGSQRAPDHAFRIGAAIALLIVGIPTFLK